MIVVIRGPLLSVTGYGTHTRQIWKWARSQEGWDVYASITPWGQCTYYIDPELEGGMIGDIMQRSTLPEGVKPHLSFQVQLPDEWDPGLANINIGVTAGIEADKCNPAWVQACQQMSKVIVPSQYSKLSFINGGLPPSKIVNVPESITSGDVGSPTALAMKQRLDNLSTSFNFLVFGQVTNGSPEVDRKNTLNCVKWICDSFKNDRDVGVVLKTNLGRLTVQDRMVAHSMIGQVVQAVRQGDFPRIHVMHGLMDHDELSMLYQHDKIKALVTATRGEGWGLPILDSAAHGLPVIATGHSGHLDFMRHVKYLDVRYTLNQIPEAMVDNRIWVSGARWADPHEDHFKSRLQKFRKGSQLPKQWAEEAKQKLIDNFCHESVSKVYDEVVRDVLQGA